MLTAEQHAMRRSGVGASEVAAVLGLSKWKSPVEVWAEKVGLMARDTSEMRLDQKLGHYMEPVMSRLYIDERPEVQLDERGTLIGPEPWMFATPDRFATVGEYPPHDEPIIHDQWLVQFKTKSYRTFIGFGADGTDEIPDDILCQVTWEMAVACRDRCDVGVLVDGREWHVFPVLYDVQLAGDLMSRVGDWWKRYVIGNVEPPVGQHAQDVEYLKKRYNKTNGSALQCTPDLERMVSRYAAATERMDEAKMEAENAKAGLMQAMGEHTTLVTPGGKLLWNQVKGRKRLDVDALLTSYEPDAAKRAAQIELYTKIGAPSRQFRLYPSH